MTTKLLGKICLLLLLIASLPTEARALQGDPNQALFAVIEDPKLKGDQARIKIETLIAQGADVNARNAAGITPLLRAAQKERLDLVTELLKRGATPKAADREGNTPLMYSVWWRWEADFIYGGREENTQKIATALLESGADIDAANRDGMTPLMRAAGWHHDGMVKFFIERGAKIQLTDKQGATALTWGAWDGKESKTVLVLREKGAEVGVLDALLMSDRPAAVDALQKGTGLQVRGPYGMTALMAAAEMGDAEIVSALLERGADPNLHDNRGYTALILAFAGRVVHFLPSGMKRMSGKPDDPERLRILRALAAKGADLNYRVPITAASPYPHDLDGVTPLQMAILHSPLPVIQFLIENGADLNQAGQEEKTPLMTAVSDRTGFPREIPLASGPEIAKLLIAKGANVNYQPAGGRTVLMQAVEDPKMLSLLLDHGAKIDLKDTRGTNALMYAAQKNKQSVSLLLARGADVRTRDHNRCTALTYAAEPYFWKEGEESYQLLYKAGTPFQLIDALLINNKEAIKSQLAQGKSANVLAPDGRPALMVAAERGDAALVGLLLKHGADPKRRSEQKETGLSIAITEKEFGAGFRNAKLSPHPNYPETVRLLLEAGDNINAPDHSGETPLIQAIICEDLPIVRLLLKYHPDLKIRYDGKTAMEWAEDRDKKREDLVHLLKDANLH